VACDVVVRRDGDVQSGTQQSWVRGNWVSNLAFPAVLVFSAVKVCSFFDIIYIAIKEEDKADQTGRYPWADKDFGPLCPTWDSWAGDQTRNNWMIDPSLFKEVQPTLYKLVGCFTAFAFGAIVRQC